MVLLHIFSNAKMQIQKKTEVAMITHQFRKKMKQPQLHFVVLSDEKNLLIHKKLR